MKPVSASQVVVLVRHGEAVSKEKDPRRPLSPAGREHVEQISHVVAGLGLELREVRHSGKERARQTAEILAARLGVSPEHLQEAPGLGPKDDVGPVADDLERKGRSVALVGHLPFMELLASRLLSGEAGLLRVHFGDGGCLVATRIEGGWRLDALINHDARP